MKTRSLSPGTFAITIHRGVFAFLIALVAAPGVGRAEHGVHTVSYSNGIDAPVVIADEGPGDDNPLEHEIEVNFSLEDPIGDDWIASGTIHATTTDPAGATLVVTDTTIKNITGNQVIAAQILVSHVLPPFVLLDGAYVAHIDGSFDNDAPFDLGTLSLDFSASITGKSLGGQGFQVSLVPPPKLFDWTGNPVQQDTIIAQNQNFIFYIDELDNTINFFDSASILPVAPVPSMSVTARIALPIAMGLLGLVIWRSRAVIQ